jgi:creatinine amidohydrolase
MEKYILANTTYKSFKDQKTELAVLPWGATEAHNYHLPYSTDNIMTEKIAAAAAAYASGKGGNVIVLPVVPFGVNTGQMDIRIDINLNPSTQFAILCDIADVLDRHGIYKFLILNGHGGNDFKQMIRELGVKFPRMFFCSGNWYQAVDSSIFEHPDDHAGEMETSLMLYLAPELVLPLIEAGEGRAKKFRIKALNEKWAWAERKWSQVTTDTGIGNPYKASTEKGERCFRGLTEKIGSYMLDLCKADIANMYE